MIANERRIRIKLHVLALTKTGRLLPKWFHAKRQKKNVVFLFRFQLVFENNEILVQHNFANYVIQPRDHIALRFTLF